jgi:hypothetical protein
MDSDLSHEDLANAVDQVVEEVLESAGVQVPPVDALALARRHGLELELDPGLTEEQRHAVAAHALGKHFKPAILTQLGLDPAARRPMMGESLAGLFAGRLLVPSLFFDEDASYEGFELPALKARFATAEVEVIALRLLDLPEPCVVTVLEDAEVRRRKSNGPRVKKKLAPAEVECERQVARDGQPHVVRKAGWTVQGWPVVSAGRRRVVLRSVVEEEQG